MTAEDLPGRRRYGHHGALREFHLKFRSKRYPNQGTTIHDFIVVAKQGLYTGSTGESSGHGTSKSCTSFSIFWHLRPLELGKVVRSKAVLCLLLYQLIQYNMLSGKGEIVEAE